MRIFVQQDRVWKVWQKANAVTVEWGQIGGKMQRTTTHHEPVNVGKSNEKRATKVATEAMERLILRQTRRGWKEVDEVPEKASDEEEVILDFIHMPSSLRFYKPNNNLTAHLIKKAEQGNVIYTRKRDGELAVAMFGYDRKWRIFSSTMAYNHKDEPGNQWINRYPAILHSLQFMEVPEGSIFLGELVTNLGNDEQGFERDNLETVATVTRSLTDEALTKQQETHIGLCLWDIAFWSSECLLSKIETGRRLRMMHDLVYKARKKIPAEYPPKLTHVEMFLPKQLIFDDGEIPFDDFNGTVDHARQFAADMKWEGFVVHDKDGIFEEPFRMDGKFPRPKYVGKLKPELEADFIVRWDPDNKIGEHGKGKKEGGVGSLAAYLLNPELEEVFISNIPGLTDELCFSLNDPSIYPLVAQVKFTSWTDKGSLQFPRLQRIRDDKPYEHCALTQMPEELWLE